MRFIDIVPLLIVILGPILSVVAVGVWLALCWAEDCTKWGKNALRVLILFGTSILLTSLITWWIVFAVENFTR